MIKFFRSIRKGLMEKNKTGKYLKYAIGEIILVVIGILIALSINNWNQERIEQKETKVLLRNLSLDIEEHIKNLKYQQNLLKIRKDWADFILKSLDDQKVVDSTLFISTIIRVGWIMDYSQMLPTYTEIISSGKLSYINSENLKKALADYQSKVELNQQILSTHNLGLKETERLAIGHLNGMPEASNLIKPHLSYPGVSFDLKSIATDAEFYKNIKHISFQSAGSVDYISDELITNAEQLKSLIAEEYKTY
ncbi:DUF6090 family protein [Maribacter sp. CXY002]|uniref:DUF6090 family protein n=1 Tax=Maribacter luteocoastalis TaxID=3407671 RepID=UPI003B678F54